MTPDHRTLEDRFRADSENDEALQDRLLECDDEQVRVCVCECVCVCVCKRERDRECVCARERENGEGLQGRLLEVMMSRCVCVSE